MAQTVPGSNGGYRHDDPAFGLKWPVPVSEMSDKDKAWPDFVQPEKSGVKPSSMPVRF